MPFRKRYLRERCAECSSFLYQQGQKKMGVCTNCAKKELDKIKNSRRIRTLIGLVLASVFLSVMLSLNANNFDNALTELSTGMQVLTVLGCFLFPFAKFVSMEDIFPTGSSLGDFEEAGFIAVIEFLISAFTGPIFFIHGLYKIRKLSSYINSQAHNGCLEDL